MFRICTGTQFRINQEIFFLQGSLRTVDPETLRIRISLCIRIRFCMVSEVNHPLNQNIYYVNVDGPRRPSETIQEWSRKVFRDHPRMV